MTRARIALGAGAMIMASLGLFAADRVTGAWGVAYAPHDRTKARPAIVFLHGMWEGPEGSCGVLERGAAPFGVLVCPRANTPFDGGTMWTGTAVQAQRQIAAALAAVDRASPGALDRAAPGTLVGYSNGAYFAAEVACAEPGRWSGLILLSMKLDLDPQRLRAARVHRILLAAGDGDDTSEPMRATAARLAAAGLDARFVSLGPGGHAWPADMPDRMVDAIRWVRGP